VTEKEKVRPVWGYPTEVINEEARFFIPLLAHLKQHNNETDGFYGLGLDTALSGQSHIARNMHTPGVELCLCTDQQGFDYHVANWTIRDVFALMSDWFDFSRVQDSQGKVWNVNSDQTARRWKAIISYFINTKIRTPTGLRVQKSHGVPSGSMFTNVIDTFVNAVQTRTVLYRVTGSLPIKDYYYGDDSVVFLSSKIFDIEAFSSVLTAIFGGSISVEKTILTDNIQNIQWLGYYYRPAGPARSLDFIIASTIYPEREVSTPVESCARLLGQLYSTMDPKAAVPFYDALRHLQNENDIHDEQVESLVHDTGTKTFKYLTNLGFRLQDITVPECHHDPFGGRFIPSVMPRPSPRRFIFYRDLVLPEFAFVPEAYSNRVLRPTGLVDFDIYKTTFKFYNEFELDEAYFSA